MDSYSAVILSGGSGRRMGGSVPKQYMQVLGRPLLAYTLMAFEKSPVDEIVLVVSEGYADYCRMRILKTYGIHKVRAIVYGGKERYDSVYAGLKAASGEYVLIHDGARALVTPSVITRSMEAVREYGSCAAGMPVKDTIRETDSYGNAVYTPDRSRLWQVQTPQCFRLDTIRKAYRGYIDKGAGTATDDAMVLTEQTGQQVRMFEGSYDNIKVTTPEDLVLAEAILRQQGWKDAVSAPG